MRLIDADALLEELGASDDDIYCRHKLDDAPTVDIPTVDLPTVDAEPVEHGHWIRTGRTNIYGGIELVCSECGDHVMVQHIEDELYCRHCGARLYGARYEE